MSPPEIAEVRRKRTLRRVGWVAAMVLAVVIAWRGCQELWSARFGHAPFDLETCGHKCVLALWCEGDSFAAVTPPHLCDVHCLDFRSPSEAT